MDWRYYNHAMIPTTAPHLMPNLDSLDDGSIWKYPGTPLLARWTTEFDCGYETSWWYCIKDEPFDISNINSKKRYEINKGKKNFDVKVINPTDYVDELYDVTIAAYESWPEKYRPTVEVSKFKSGIKEWENKRILAAFTKEDNLLVGYAYLTEHDSYVDFNMLRVVPQYERLAINAAIVNGIVELYNTKLSKSYYILDGARSISHETAFQDYLEKYFEFRKAYCNLHIKYRAGIGVLIKCLYPFRSLLRKLDSVGPFHGINGLLLMESIARDKR